MIIKLAIFNDKKIEKIVIECCSKYGSFYIPLVGNNFGLLSVSKNVIYGREDADYSNDLNIKTFVDIYSCVDEQNKSSIFPIKKSAPYSGKLLDNLFFEKIIKLCLEKNIEISCLRYVTEYGTESDAQIIDDLIGLIKSNERMRILKLIIVLQNCDIVFNKKGYVEICSKDVSVYTRVKKELTELLNVGLEDF